MKKSRLIGEELVREGIITEKQLKSVLKDLNGKSIVKAIFKRGFASEKDVAKALAKISGLDYVDLNKYEIDPNAATVLSEETAYKYKVIPIKIEDDQLVVAVSDPSNVIAIDDLKLITKMEIEPVVAAESEIMSAIEQYTRIDKEVEELTEIDEDVKEVTKEVEEEAESDDAPIVKLINAILTEGVRARASDILVEPQANEVRIRYRIDGVLHDVMKNPKSAQLGMVTRLKLMANLDIAEKRLPQDGRFSLIIDGRQVDFRLATLPTIHGEIVVMRILEKESILISLEDLGFLDVTLDKFKKSLIKPYGAILVTGPTGSGKTTTLYASLHMINDIDKNIITVEDPVEYRLDGCSQVQVNERADMTFANALRSILRNDPDIVMIGEIRDRPTALIAVESALTGHLVLSTLHTNDAPSAITRLIEMDIEPFLIASAIDCVVAQRLARRLCTKCKEAYEPERDFLKSVGYTDEDIKKIDVMYRAKGCDYCSNTGYRGRMGLYELMLTNDDIKQLTLAEATSEEIKKVAIKNGMMTLRRTGLIKAMSGETSIEEVLRVVV